MDVVGMGSGEFGILLCASVLHDQEQISGSVILLCHVWVAWKVCFFVKYIGHYFQDICFCCITFGSIEPPLVRYLYLWPHSRDMYIWSQILPKFICELYFVYFVYCILLCLFRFQVCAEPAIISLCFVIPVDVITLKNRRKTLPNKWIQEFYHTYFSRRISDQDKSWATYSSCKSCVENLRQCASGEKSISFTVEFQWYGRNQRTISTIPSSAWLMCLYIAIKTRRTSSTSILPLLCVLYRIQANFLYQKHTVHYFWEGFHWFRRWSLRWDVMPRWLHWLQAGWRSVTEVN